MVAAGLAVTDLARGGRWTHLVLAGRDWLWSRPEPRRQQVRPGDPFADAGGLEECVPTVRGLPDHGAVWSRPWQPEGPGAASVSCPDFTLTRLLQPGPESVTARYELRADPGYRFIWAAHALLDVSAGGTVTIPGSSAVRLYPEAAPLLRRPWPAGAPYLECRWPGPDGLRLDRLGPDDGSAVGAIMPGCPAATVTDGAARLQLRVSAPAGVPVSVALWRNLGGFGSPEPYRSIGVEPMLGAAFDLAQARRPADAAVVPASGMLAWALTLTGEKT